VYIDGEMYSSPLLSGEEVFKASIKDTDVAVFVRSSNLYGVLTGDDPFQYFGGLSMAIARVSDGERPEMWITNAREIGNPRMQTLRDFINMEMRTQMLNPNYIKGMMWGWDVVDTRFVDANDWNEVYDVYIQDKYDLGIKDWFDENSPWAQQTMTARMLEAARKQYWTPSEEVKAILAEEYQQSVEKFGPCCCVVCCGNVLLDTYMQGIISAVQQSEEEQQERRHGSSGGSSVRRKKLMAEGVTNQTTSTGVGTVEEAIAELPEETGETAESIKTGRVMQEEEPASAPAASGAPLMGLIAVIVILCFVGLGFWMKARKG
jgi:cobaltochelatase CobN